MPLTFKVLGQQNPGAAVLTNLYVVPAATQVVSSTLFVCNRSNVATLFRVSVAVAGVADDPMQYLWYDTALAGNTTLPFTVGMTLNAADVVRVYAFIATVTFTLFGTERTP